jgi:hypothetical protein
MLYLLVFGILGFLLWKSRQKQNSGEYSAYVYSHFGRIFSTITNPYALKHVWRKLFLQVLFNYIKEYVIVSIQKFGLIESAIIVGKKAPEATLILLDGVTKMRLIEDILMKSPDLPLIMNMVSYN